MIKVYIWITFLFTVGNGRPEIIEEEVLDEILYNYNNLARPATYETPKVIVKHGLNLVRIIECDGKSLKAETWLEMSWEDPRLTWSLSYYNIKSLSLPSKLIWTPDIVLYNNPSSHAGNAYNPRVFIFNTGSVSWFPPTTIETSCKENDFDKDIVYCVMTFGSWSYDGNAVDIQLMYDDIELRDYVENQDWEYMNSTIIRNEKHYPCCTEPYADVTYNITLRRLHAGSSQNLPTSTNGVITNGKNNDDAENLDTGVGTKSNTSTTVPTSTTVSTSTAVPTSATVPTNTTVLTSTAVPKSTAVPTSINKTGRKK